MSAPTPDRDLTAAAPPIWPGAVLAITIGLVYVTVAGRATLTFGPSHAPHHLVTADAWLHGQLHARPAALQALEAKRLEYDRGRVDRILRRAGLTWSEDQKLEFVSSISSPVDHDWSIVQGRRYAYWPPMPVVLLLPYVALAGLAASDILLGCVVGAGGVFLIYLTIRELGRAGIVTTNTPACAALTILFGLGTVHFYSACLGQVWYLSSVVGAFFLSLAVWCLLRSRNRLLWVAACGAALGAAILSRNSIIATTPFFLIYVLARRGKCAAGRPIRAAVGFCIPLLIACGINLAYNNARFGSPWESGQGIQVLTGGAERFQENFRRHGAVSLHYLPRNLKHYFLQFVLERAPYTGELLFDRHGNSMFMTTPALLYLFASFRRRNGVATFALWAGVAGALSLLLTFHATGTNQFGNRYLLDCLPLMIPLVAIGMRGRLTAVSAALIAVSLAINAWGTQRYFKYFVERVPSPAELHFQAGLYAESQERVPQAVAEYRTAIRFWPRFAQAHNNLGVISARRGEGATAVGHFKQALEIDPDFLGARYNLANALSHSGRPAEAAAAFREVLRIAPSLVEAHNGLGAVLLELNQTGPAIEHFVRALRQQAGYQSAINNLARTLAAYAVTDDVIRHFGRDPALDPAYARAYVLVGDQQQAGGDADAAIAAYRRALEIESDNADALEQLLQLGVRARP